MKKEKKQPKIILRGEEVETEDWCFICKDGGDLMFCDFGQCTKVYHADCVRTNGSCSKIQDGWTCDRHICLSCRKTPRFNCFCCPNAVCRSCMGSVDFLIVKDGGGFCDECLELVLLGEEDEPCDSDGAVIDFKDRDTHEGLFKEYWDIIKEQEGLTIDDIHTAMRKVKKRKSCKRGSGGKLGKHPNDDDDEDEDFIMLDDDEEETKIPKLFCKRKVSEHDEEDTKSCKRLCNRMKSKVLQFCGWASKPLIEFLKSIGKDTTEPLCLSEVHRIIESYIQEKKLVYPEKRNQVHCDERLFSIFRKKTLKKRKIYYLLENHFVEMLEEHDIDNVNKKKYDGNEVDTIYKPTGFASIVSANIKLVYLRRTLVEELFQQPESFEQKVVGSFIRMKNDAKACLQGNSNQLLPVTGVEKSSTGEILLKVSSMSNGVRVHMLLDSDITENECQDLQEKIENGVFKKLPVVELEEKARSLYEDITKHWIKKELILLQNYIDYANEKGRRRELNDYIERRELLEKPCYQEKLLQKLPKVIPEVVALKAEADVVEID